MPRPSQIRQRGPNGRFLSSRPSVPEAQQSGCLFRLPTEIRLAIYEFSFTINNNKCTLRRMEDLLSLKSPIPFFIGLFSNSILTTCKTIYAEALPLFYASQTFHYPAEVDGLFCQPAIKHEYLQWVKHISIDVTLNLQSFKKLEPIVTRHVEKITKHCPKLSSFTLHVIPASESQAFDTARFFLLELIPPTLNKGIAARALRKLRPRLDELSIVSFGKWDTLHDLRKAIASDDQWVEGDKCYKGPELSLSVAQKKAVSSKQRRYTLVGYEDVIHPHKECVRIFHAYRPKKSEDKA